MRDPSLYQIGLKKECFSNGKFWFWIAYGASQAAMVLWFTFYQMELDFTNFWSSGATVLLGVVMVVNLLIIAQMHIFDVVGVALPLLSILVYFFVFWFMNLKFYKSDSLYGTFSM